MNQMINALLAELMQNGPAAPHPTDALEGLMMPATAEPFPGQYGPTLPTPGVDTIGNMDMPTPYVRPPAVASETTSRDPDERMDGWRKLLTNFTFSLASGLSARAQNPRAGTGAALMAPFELERQRLLDRQRQQQINTAAASEERQRSAADQIRAMIAQNQAELPEKMANLKATRGRINSQVALDNARLPQIAAQTARDQAQANLTQAQATAARYKLIPNLGLFDLQTKQVVPGSEETKFKVAISKELAEATGLPAKMIGQEMTAQEFNQITAHTKPGTGVVALKDGKWLINEATGEKIVRLGDLPVTPQSPAAEEGRTDRSYQFHTQQITAIAKPITDTLTRMERLQDTLREGTPQTDALVGPELLSVIAGGQGSGLRMSEAEIYRVVHGRSKWENLKAAVAQWRLDPRKANSITDEQRQEIHDLVAAVSQHLSERAQLVTDAQQALADTTDPEKHRQIFAKLRSDLLGGKATVPAPTAPAGQKKIPGVQSYRKVPGPGGE